MAIIIKVPDEAVLAVGQQAAFGTALGDTDDFDNTTPEFGHQIKCDAPTIDLDVKQRDDPTPRGARYMDVRDMNRDQKGSNPKLSIPEHILRKDSAAMFLYAMLQSVTEGEVGAEYSKAFTFHATQPDFTADAGCFLTALLKMPVASKSVKIADMICQSLKLKCDPGEVLRMACELFGRGTPGLTSNPNTGTWAVADDDFFYFEDIAAYTYDFSGAASPGIGGFELDLTQTITPVGQDATTGGCQSYGLSKFGGKFTGSFIWNGTEHALLTNFPLGTELAIAMNWGTVDTDGYLALALNGVLEKVELGFTDVITANIDMNLGGHAGDSTEPVTITLVDNVDKAW